MGDMGVGVSVRDLFFKDHLLVDRVPDGPSRPSPLFLSLFFDIRISFFLLISLSRLSVILNLLPLLVGPGVEYTVPTHRPLVHPLFFSCSRGTP